MFRKKRFVAHYYAGLMMVLIVYRMIFMQCQMLIWSKNIKMYLNGYLKQQIILSIII